MRRYLIPLILGLIFLLAPVSKAQTTTVNATIQDAAGQALIGGSYSFSTTALGIPPIKGPLDVSGSFSGVVIPHTPATALVNDYWTVTICPDATFGCSTKFIQIVNATADLTSVLSPTPAIQISIPAFPDPVTAIRAYADSEIVSTPKGGSYFNVLSGTVRSCTTLSSGTLSPGACSAWSSSSAGSVGPGTVSYLSCFTTTTNVGNCADALTDIAGTLNFPANMNVGGGGPTTTIGYPSGPPANCKTPAAGVNYICSDGTNNTMLESDNGNPYIPTVKQSGSVVGGNCGSWNSLGVLQDSGAPCNNFPSSGPPHTAVLNPTESTGSLLTPHLIGDNDVFPNVWCTTTGSADAYVATLPAASTALTAGVVLHMIPNFTNTTVSPTVNLSTLGAKNILKTRDGVLVNVVPGDLAINVEAVLHYDGTQFELLNPATTRSMWPCAPQSGLTDTIDNTTSPTETLFTTVCKIPAGTLITGMVIDGQLGLDWTATATVPNSTFKMYLCPTLGSLTGCKNVFTGTTSPASAGTFSAVLPFALFGRQAASGTAAVTQQAGAGVGANTPFGRNSIAGNLTNVPTNADLYIQFTYAIAANTAGNSATIRSLFFR